jgi:hypothetical protein
MTLLNVGAFRQFRCGYCPETPRGFGVQARPETPHSAINQTLKPGASFSQGVRLILRHVTVTFSTPQTPFVLQDQRAKERKNA